MELVGIVITARRLNQGKLYEQLRQRLRQIMGAITYPVKEKNLREEFISFKLPYTDQLIGTDFSQNKCNQIIKASNFI